MPLNKANIPSFPKGHQSFCGSRHFVEILKPVMSKGI